MYLKSIELSGFKSFQGSTEVILEPGITAIVGPNGCGKSNIVDSIRWSLGELSPKTLRSKAIADVIFNGTRRLSPATYAQVTLTFDNTDRVLGVDSAEVSVSRKVYRDSASEYSINKGQCRLKDIKNLFLGTGLGDDGYSIMEGSMVEFLLTAKPFERRLLFDEASGAARFASKREEALGKLSKIELDLNRVQDQIELIETERRRLENQAKRAKTYEKLITTKKALETQRAIRLLDELTLKIKSLQKESIEPKTKEIEIKTVELDQMLASLQKVDLEKLESEKILQAKTEAYHETLRSHDLILEKLKHFQEKLQEKDSLKTTTSQEEENQKAQETELSKELENLKETIAQKEATLKTKSSSWQDLDALKASLMEFSQKREFIQKDIRDHRTKILDITQETISLKNKTLTLTTEVSRLEAELKITLKEHKRTSLEKTHREETLKENETFLQSFKQESLTLEQELESLGKTKKELETQKQSLEEELFRTLPREEATGQSRLKHWEDLYGNNPRIRGAKAIDDLVLDGLNGVYGPMGKKIKTSPNYYASLKDILGDKLQWFLAENMETAQAALERLRHEKKGRVTFVLLDRIRDTPATGAGFWESVPKGQTTRIVDLEHILGSTDIRTKKAIFYLLGPTFIQGSTIYGEAIIHGGEEVSQTNESQALSILEERQEIVQALDRLGRQKEELTKNLEALETKLRASDAQITELEKRRQTKLIEVSHKTNEQESVSKELNLMQDTMLAIEHETQEKLSTISQKNEELNSLTLKIKDLETASQHLGQELSQLEQELEKALIEEKTEKEANLTVELLEERARQELAVLKERKTQIERNLETIKTTADRFKHSIEQLELEIETLKTTITETQKELEDLQVAKEEKGKELTLLQSAHENLNLKLQALSEEQTSLEEQLNTAKDELNQRELELKTLEFEKTKTQEEAVRIFGCSEDELTTKIKEAKKELNQIADSAQDLSDALVRLNERIEKLGQINFLAQEEYDRLQERISFLETQSNDIKKAQDDVRQAINTINSQIEESFKVTYGAVRAKFREIFAELFEGGEADLALVENENPLYKGVEIYAQPPGKKLQSLALLSQGEKALTAVSLLFAFFATKPAPVCVLDEIDAPLDEANVQRFRKLLSKFSENVQFLIITHNKRSMEAAHALYGITMEELGVSKVISVKLEEVTASVGDVS